MLKSYSNDNILINKEIAYRILKLKEEDKKVVSVKLEFKKEKEEELFKESYEESVNKRSIQRNTLGLIRDRDIICLGGPSLKDYVNTLKEFKFKKIFSFEKDKKVLKLQQEQGIEHKDVYIQEGNICDHLSYHEYFYDLDFCCCITTIEEHLEKILAIPGFTMTLSVRPLGYKETIEIINKYNKNNYELSKFRYSDTSPMITIFKDPKFN